MRSRRNDSGQAAVQFAGMMPIVLLAVLLCFKVYVAINAIEEVDNAARTGAREASLNHDPSVCPTEAMKALPEWLTKMANPQDHLKGDRNARVSITPGGGDLRGVSCRVEAKVPVLWPAIPLNFTVVRTVHMPG